MEYTEPKIINIIGGPGAGKTVTTSLLYAKLKIAGMSVEYVPEYAKKLVLSRKFDLLDNQYYVSDKQYQKLSSVYGRVQYVITDGSLLHGLYYNRYNPTNVSNIYLTENKIIEYYNSFNNINIYLTRGDFPYEKNGRYQSEEEARIVDIQMKEVIDEYNIPYVIYKSDVRSIDEMVKYILEERSK